jgi:hypothetical protein
MKIQSESSVTRPKVLVLYEDLSTAIRAKSALDQVPGVPRLSGEGRMHIWRLDLWTQQKCETCLMQEALAAEILVLSLHRNDRLPAGAAARLQLWIGIQRGGLKALVISLDPGAQLFSEENPELVELCFAASRTGTRILLHADEATQRKEADGDPSAEVSLDPGEFVFRP